ncbi:MAG: hypothetical protein ABJB05_03400 [Parafilimonas sp.]
MLTKKNLHFFICISIIVTGCTLNKKETRLTLVPVSDSLYKPDSNYLKDILEWKNYYNRCTNKQLFSNAYYLKLQDSVYIGSINNKQEIDVNKGIHLLDTSKMSSIFNLLYITNSSNCSDTLHLTNTLKEAFLKEVKNVIMASPEHNMILDLIDTSSLKIRIGTIYTDELMPERLINLLDTTKDDSLMKYKTLLLNSENVLLSKTVELLGFSAEFSLKEKPSAIQQKVLANKVFFTSDSLHANGSISIVSNNVLHIEINKRYTLLGGFVQLKEN